MYRRGKGGNITIRIGGVRRSSGTPDRDRAKWLQTQRNAETWDAEHGRVIRTWERACRDWADANPGPSGKYENLKFEKWWKDKLKGRTLDKITPALVHEIVSKHRTVDVENKIPQNSTANEYVSFVSRIIRETSNLKPRLVYYPTLAGRYRWLTFEEWVAFSGKAYQDLADLCEFALATGLREANDMWFEWPWLKDGDTWALLPAEVTKTDRPYAIPLNRTAQAVIKRRRAAVVSHPKLVFLNRGKVWNRTAVCRTMQDTGEAAELAEPIQFHGFRHTFASWLAQKGISELIRSRLGCWKTGAMSDHYAHFDVESLRPYSEVIDSILSGRAVTQTSPVAASA